MSLSKYTLVLFFVLFCLPTGYAHLADYSIIGNTPPPVEKVKPPVEKGKKAKKRSKLNANKKNIKRMKRMQKQQNAPQGMGKRALTFWLLFAIAAILLVIATAFIIGLGLAPWVVAFYAMMGSELAAFAILICVLWIDMPGDPASIQFTFALLGLIAVNAIIGIAFFIWGLAFVWVFGWIIGLVLLGLAGIFLAIHLLLANINS